MEIHQLIDAVAEAKEEAFRLREFALKRQDDAISRSQLICGRLVCYKIFTHFLVSQLSSRAGTGNREIRIDCFRPYSFPQYAFFTKSIV
jgi:hypothetical protein